MKYFEKGFATKREVSDIVKAEIGDKVDKITGKGLSTNDFDNTYKAQLDNFTENSQDAVASALTDTATIDLTYNDELNQINADVKDGSINNVKIGTNADISTSKIKQAVITPQIGTFSNNDTQDVINNKAQGQITNLENLINTRPIGASNGSVYYLTSQASAIPNYELLSFSPDNSPLDVESITITSTTPKIDRLFHSYISTYEVGNTIINGGNWIFNFYGYTSHINNNNFEIDVYKRNSSGTETLLFTCDTSNLLQTSQISPELNVANVEITNQDFSCNTTDKIVIKIYAKTDRSVATTITLLHSGTDYASHIHTPIIATHNQLAGTQGGSATEKYHLILSDYNKVLALDTSFSLKEDVANKTTAFSATPANIKYPTEKLVKDNLDLKGNITDIRQESTRFVEKTYGLDTNDGLTIFKAFKTPERGWTDVNPSGQVKIIGGAEHTVNHTFDSSKQSIKTILDNGAKISGTINLVSGNTSMQFFDGKISATINDNSTGTCYFNGVDLSGSIINFNEAGYKYISNSSSAPALINFANLSGGATAIATLININGAISIGDGWTVIKTNSTLAITSKSSSAVLYDSNFFVINAVITSQVALNVVLSSGLAGLYIVNFASPTGITGISKGDIIYRVGGNNVIVNKFFDAPSSVSVANGISFDTWIKQANDNWVIGSISSSSRLDASNIADGSISNTEFQYLNNVSSNIQTQLDGKLNTTLKGANNGLAELDSTGKVPFSQLPANNKPPLTYFVNASDIQISGAGTSATISWNAQSNAVRYRVFAKQTSLGAINIITDTPVATVEAPTNFATVSVNQGVGYTYAVLADKSTDTATDIINFTTLTISNFTLDTFDLSAGTTATLSWGSVVGATEYRIQYQRATSLTSPTIITGITGTSRVITGLTPSNPDDATTPYSFKVLAYNGSGQVIAETAVNTRPVFARINLRYFYDSATNITVASIARSSDLATCNTTANHNLKQGDVFSIANSVAPFNVSYALVFDTPSLTSFRYVVANSGATSTSTATLQKFENPFITWNYYRFSQYLSSFETTTKKILPRNPIAYTLSTTPVDYTAELIFPTAKYQNSGDSMAGWYLIKYHNSDDAIAVLADATNKDVAMQMFDGTFSYSDRRDKFLFTADDHRCYKLWHGGFAYLQTTGDDTSNGSNFYRLNTDLTENSSAVAIANRPSELSSTTQAMPVRLSLSSYTIYFDNDNQRLIYQKKDGTRKTILTYTSLGLSNIYGFTVTAGGGTSGIAGSWYTVTNNLDTIIIANRANAFIGSYRLIFNFTAGTVVVSNISRISDTNLATEENCFGDQIDTYFNLRSNSIQAVRYFSGPAPTLTLRLYSTPLTDLSVNTTDLTMTVPGIISQTGIGPVSVILVDGSVYWIDWGHDDRGMYRLTGNEDGLGIVKMVNMSVHPRLLPII